MMTGATRRFGAWVAEAPRTWSRASVDAATGAFVDALACALGGVEDPAVRTVQAGLAPWQGAPRAVTVFGAPMRLPAPWAALSNGTAAHALDYDDILEPANAHAGAALVPAILALAEERGASGADCIDAFVVGIEVCGRAGEAVNMTHYQAGWHATSTLGTLGVAAACARLLGLDAERASHAIAMSTSLAGGSKRQFGTMTKPLHAGFAAHHGVLAATLAASGMTAGAEVLEGAWGLHDLMAGNPQSGFAASGIDCGGPPLIESVGLWQKPYPCCGSNHQALDAAKAIAARRSLDPATLAGIFVTLPQMYHSNLRYTRPEDPMQARFCLEYCLASAVLDGGLGIAAFRPEALERPELRPLMEKIVRVPRPDPVPAILPLPVAVEIAWTDGHKEHAEVTETRAMDHAALAAKFNECAAHALSDADRATALERLQGLSDVTDISNLIRGLNAQNSGT